MLQRVFTELLISISGVSMYSKIKEIIKILDSVITDENLDENVRKNLLTSRKLLTEILDEILCLRGCIREMSYIFEETMALLNMNNGSENHALKFLKDSMYTELDIKWRDEKKIAKIENIIG